MVIVVNMWEHLGSTLKDSHLLIHLLIQEIYF